MAEIALEDAPRKARELFDKGFAAFERENLDYAIDLFLSVLDLEPRVLRARKFLRAAEMKKFQAAKGGQITHIIASISGLPQLMAVKGTVKKNPLKALRKAEDLMRKDPLNKPFINALGEAAVAADLPEVAIQALELAKDFYPKDTELLNWLGNLYLETEEPGKARDCFDKVAKLKPNDQQAIKALKDATALATMRKGGWDGASSYRDVIKDSKEATLLEQDSKAVKSQKDVESLIEETKKKIQQEPGNVNYKRALADLYVKAGRFDDAVDLLAKAQEQSGGDPQIDMALSNIRMKQFEHELADLKKAGDEAAVQAKEDERQTFMLEDAQERVKRYPNDLQFRYELGVLLFERGELNEAIQHLQRAQRNPQRRIRALYYLALCFKQKQQYDIALEQLQKAAADLHVMDETKKDILYEIGSLHESMGQGEKAAAYYKEIYSVDIGYKDVAGKIDQAYKK
jgi:tetratricopeptide (TPR) repeat protein